MRVYFDVTNTVPRRLIRRDGQGEVPYSDLMKHGHCVSTNNGGYIDYGVDMDEECEIGCEDCINKEAPK